MASTLRSFVLALLVFSALSSYCQAPHISYGGPQVYTAGTAIPPLAPVNTGGVVPLISTVYATYNHYTFSGLAIDKSGNIYGSIANPNFNTGQWILKIPIDGSAQSRVAVYPNIIGGMAVDAPGNIYIADFNNDIKKIDAVADTVSVFATGFYLASGVAVDASGNVYVADEKNVKKIPAGGGAPVNIGTGFTMPMGVAVDASGNVYVADAGNNTIKEIIAATGSTITLTGGLQFPDAVTTDARGNVYFADRNLAGINEISAGGNLVAIAPGINPPYGVVIDSVGNIYTVDQAYNGAQQEGLMKINNGIYSYTISPFTFRIEF